MSDEKTTTLSKEEIEQIKKRTQKEESEKEKPEAEKNNSDQDRDS